MTKIDVPSGHYLNFDGSTFDVLNPELADISLAEIARSLSMVPRWMGKIHRFYSVAEHSMMVCQIAMTLASRDGLSQREVFVNGLKGLLHDATEAYLCDIPRPLKHIPEMAFYVKAEKRLHFRIFDAFGLTPELTEQVCVADDIALGIEQRDLRPFGIAGIPDPADWRGDFGYDLTRKTTMYPGEAERGFAATAVTLQSVLKPL